MTDGGAAPPPSWEQLLTGAHPSFGAADAASAGRGPARHGRDGWRDDNALIDPADPADLAPQPQDDAMSWGDAVLWTVVAGAVAMTLASRLGGLLH